jgi:hypothetical protein
VPGLRRALTPPSRPGFPPTHALIQTMWQEYVDAVEAVLVRQPFLLGQRFTIADAGVYGQLAMNLTDPTAAETMRRRVPTTFAWLEAIRDRCHVGRGGAVGLSAELAGLLAVVTRTFVPLMRQNASAYEQAWARGVRMFNERAFDAGRALYDGTLLGQPFRSVAKTFQVRVWRELETAWRDLAPTARDALAPFLGDAFVG